MLSPRSSQTRAGPSSSSSRATSRTHILHFHKHKLHTILLDNELYPAVRGQHASKELDDEKVAANDKEVRVKEFIEACNEGAFAILIIKIGDTIAPSRTGCIATTMTMRMGLGCTCDRAPARGQGQ
eukprot:5780000-Pleurochrysis_carterae.AAC.2